MQYQSTAPAREDRPKPSQQQMETAILNLLMGEDSFTVWIRDELAHEFPRAGVVFEDALDSLARADVLHTYGPWVKLSRAAARTAVIVEITESKHPHVH